MCRKSHVLPAAAAIVNAHIAGGNERRGQLSRHGPAAYPFSATATLSGSTAMSGTYSTFNCNVADGGPFNITNQ
jgi:hypothetical protein